MSFQPMRRHFLQCAATAGAAFGLGEWARLLPISPATAAEAKVTPDLVRFSPDIEPVVRDHLLRLMERFDLSYQTDRDRHTCLLLLWALLERS